MEKLGRQLQRLEAEVGGAALLESVLNGAEIIRAQAEVLAPRATGRLAGDIAKQAVQASSERAVVEVGFLESAFHGFFQELGTSTQAAQPFLRPAFDGERHEAVRVIRDSLTRHVQRAISGAV